MMKNDQLVEALIEAAQDLSKKYIPSISGFKFIGTQTDTYDEDKIKSEVQYINKNLSKVLKDSCDAITDIERSSWTKAFCDKQGTTPEKAFQPSEIVSKEFDCSGSTVTIHLSFKWYKDMMYNVYIKDNKITDAECIGD